MTEASLGRRLAGALLALGASGTMTVAASAPAQAATCYGGAVQVTNWTRSTTYDWQTPIYKTSSRCADINIRSNLPANSWRVHWIDKGTYGPWRYLDTTSTKWAVVATDVKDYTRFRIEVTGEVIQANPPATLGSMYVAY